MKRVLVVGGGIAGLTTVSTLMPHMDVDLIESAEQFGGLLGGEQSWNGLNFDYGSHYLQKTGHAELDEMLFSFLNEDNSQQIDLMGGSFYRTLNQDAPTLNLNDLDAASVAYQTLAAFLDDNPATEDTPATLKEYLVTRFGQVTVDQVLTPVYEKLFGCSPDNLHVQCKDLFGLTRVQFGSDAFLERVKQDPYFDAFLAYNHRVPRDKLIYPHKGMGDFIRMLTRKIASHPNATLMSSAFISGIDYQTPGHKTYTVHATHDGQTWSKEYDAVFWTVSPVNAAKVLDAKLMQLFVSRQKPGAEPFRKISLYHLVVDEMQALNLHYFYVYDPSTPVLRVTIYPNTLPGQPKKLTIEVFEYGDGTDEAFIKRELVRFGVLSEDHQVLWMHKMQMKQGFPVMTLANTDSINELNEKIVAQYDAFFLLGRKPNQFFMKDVIMDAYNQTRIWANAQTQTIEMHSEGS